MESTSQTGGNELSFWFDFASTYSYLSAMRIDELAAATGVAVRWRPFLLGPIFKAQGWATSPFNLYPAKGRYMVRDVARIANERGLAFRMPETFPAHSLKAARAAMVISRDGDLARFSKGIFTAEFAEGLDISDDATLAWAIRESGADPVAVMNALSDDETKGDLRRVTDGTARLGIFGAPMFVTPDGEMFWGDDRLEAAIRWMRQNDVA